MAIVTNGLVGYWHYKQGIKGNTWHNIAPTTKGQYDGTIYGATLAEKGMFFDGVNDFIEIINFMTTVSNPTVQVGFIRDEEPVGDDQVFLSASNGFQFYLFGNPDGDFELASRINGTDILNVTTPIPTRQQFHLSVSKLSSDKVNYSYMNDWTASYSTTNSIPVGGTLNIGKEQGTATRGTFKGHIQYIRIYNRPLTNAELDQNYVEGTDVGLPNTPTGATVIPATPTNFKAQNLRPLDINFVWDYQTDANEFILKRDGSIVYQGNNNTYTDKSLQQQTSYTYELTAKNEIGSSTKVSLQLTTPVLRMKYLPIGAKVTMGVQEFVNKSVNGSEDIVWQVASQDHWTWDSRYPVNATTLATEKVIRFLPFDNSSQNWWASHIRQWLNSDADAGKWYSPKYDGNSTPFFYVNDAGFMRYFSSLEKSILVPTSVTEFGYSSDYSVWREKEWWTVDYFYLGGATEIAGGVVFNFGEDGYYMEGLRRSNVRATDLAWANYSQQTQPETGVEFFTRSRRRTVENNTFTKIFNSATSTWSTSNSVNTPNGIRPMCNANGDTLMEEIFINGVGTGVYKIASTQQYKKKFPSTAKIKDLPLDTIIKMGTNKFVNKRIVGEERMLWRILSNNHWLKDDNYPENAVTMISERIVRYMAFAPANAPDGYPNGVPHWILSTISNYLNSNEANGEWFSPSIIVPYAPDLEHVLHNKGLNQPYDKDNGFLTFFKQKELDAIVETQITTINGLTTNSSGQVQASEQMGNYKFFLPSFREITGEENLNARNINRFYVTEGRLFNIDSRLNLIDALDTDLAFYNSPFYNTPEKRNIRKQVWFRSLQAVEGKEVVNGAVAGSTNSLQDTNTLGDWGVKSDFPAYAYGIRPVCNINGETEVHLTEVINGVPVYEIEDSPVIEYTGDEWSDARPELNPPIIPPDRTAPSEVVSVNTSVTTNSIAIHWTNPKEVDFSHVNIYKDGFLMVSKLTNTTYTVDNLKEGKTHYFRITTVDLAGNESEGIGFTSTTITIDRTPPNEVTNVIETHTDSSVTLTWSNPSDSDFAYVRIYQNDSLIFNNFNNTVVTILSIPADTTQKFKITTVDLNGNESNGTFLSVTTSPSASPDDVRNLNTSSDWESVTLYWDKASSTDYSHAEIYRNGVKVQSIAHSPIRITGLTDDTAYTFKIVAVDLDGNKSDGVTVIVKTKIAPDSIAPSEVIGLGGSTNDVSATLDWTNPSDSDFVYAKVYYKNTLVKDNISNGKVTINGLNNNTEYIFKVSTVDKSGNISAGKTITLTTNDSSTGTYKTTGDLPLGAKLKMGANKFEDSEEPIYWTVIDKNHNKLDNGYPENGVTFITNKNIRYSAFDSLGRKIYNQSEIAYWLLVGFLNGFSPVEKNSMLNTSAKYNNANLVSKVFLPSTTEIQDNFVNSANGKLFPYFTNNSAFKYTNSTTLAFSHTTLSGTVDTPQRYWVRDADINGNLQYIDINDSSRVGATTNEKALYGVRPITNINRTTLIEAVAGETGVFKIQGATTIPTAPPSTGGELQGNRENNCLIHVLNPSDLSIEGIVDNYESASMTINYNTIGDFIILINNRIENAMLFTKQKYVIFNGDGKFAGLITSVQIELDDDGNEIRTVKGKTLGHLLSYRVVAMDSDTKTADTFNGLGERAIKYYVRRNTVEAPIDRDKRSFPNFQVTIDKNLGQTIERQYYYENLLDVVEEIAQLQDLGYEIFYDVNSNKIVFDVYAGKDLSVNQESYNPVILSAEIGNLEGQTYIYDENNDKTFAYVNRNDVDTTDGTQPQVIMINKDNVNGQISSGITRKETFFKIDSNEKGYYVPSSILGEEKLSSQTAFESFEVTIMENQMFTYGIDYNLGDIITVFNEKWNVSADIRVVGVTLDMNSDKEYNISLTFGAVLPTLTGKIRKTIEDYDPNKHKAEW